MLAIDHFFKYFRLDFARTPEQLRAVQRARYDVYVKEFGFENPDDCPDGLERDSFDVQSLHCMAVYQGDNKEKRPADEEVVAGCVRVVLPTLKDPDGMMPLERYCQASLDPANPRHPRRTPRDTLCEISRLAAHPEFRRRPREAETRIGALPDKLDLPSEEEMRTYPLVSMAMICASPAIALLVGRPNMFIMVEHWLAKLLKRLGIPLEQIGEPTDYHGTRTAFYIRAEGIVEGFNADMRQLYDRVEASLRANLAQDDLATTIRAEDHPMGLDVKRRP
ncbi:PEP-CTERM/exosortase system-associated acyltransferase [Ectothiorhodospira shaposhnikovii]|uniref:PEP-CTERM/exosortase system-associated acyltransferase n=1 Tax=Ectothiorhodospira shaposhnikovii TaxID=1054 RepID=UPI001EE811D6|nr:PEP-CTERM/exosortase system-associated acyltransferase [Ectothiorhodospira shaposhnikovii]MCG5512185.1 PEP-CTERM/exosortase system-associated acyltransferase [Ectothiorhodospira shaposhnikovii]